MVSSQRSQVVLGDDVKLSVIDRSGEGDKPAFLLVHGLASNARLWDGVGERLAAAGHPSIAVDQRGHGQSFKPDSGYDFATVTADLAALVKETIGRPVVVAGQSWGGNVVLEFAARYPQLTAGCVLVDGGFIRLREPFPDWETVRSTLAPPDFSGFTVERMDVMRATRFPDWPQSGIEGQIANFEVLPDGGVRPWLSRDNHLRILRELWSHDPDLVAPEVSVPTLIIAVGGDDTDRFARVEGFAALLESGRVVWMDADHDVHAQHPDRVADLMLGMVGFP